jgi:hypothetical protein
MDITSSKRWPQLVQAKVYVGTAEFYLGSGV